MAPTIIQTLWTGSVLGDMRHFDLFSGIGGFALGLRMAGGYETVGFCEIESFARQVLAKHWPDVPIYKDIRELDADAIGDVDIITAGWPCQPFSRAGERKGQQDDRYLWPEVNRLLVAVRPTWFIGENVTGLFSLGIDTVLSDLADAGYGCWPVVLPACAIDAPHRRDRIFICAYTDSDRQQEQCASGGTVRREPRNDTVRLCADVPDTGGAGLQVSEQEDICGARRREEGGAAAKRSRWPTEPGLCRVAYGVPNRVDRLKALGNSVVPGLVAEIGRVIHECNP